MNPSETYYMLTLVTVGILVLSIVMVFRYLRKRRVVELASELMEEPPLEWAPPHRNSVMDRLRSGTFDLLIIGGGATGAGCALDAATRGLRVALVDAGDFGSGTSSKSTKLVHGGVRYLAKAVSNLDWSQYQLVQQALNERHIMFRVSPYLTRKLRIMVPIYNRILVPYYYIGLKIYDWLSGLRSLGRSYFVTRDQAVDAFPYINRKKLCGAMVYYDGQQHDARNNVMLTVTAAYYKAAVANHVTVRSLMVEDGKITGAVCLDGITGEVLNVRASGVINSTGSFSDDIRRMGGPNVDDMLTQSSGSHIVISREYTPKTMGLLDPNTMDHRVAFFLPWMGKSLVGATDVPASSEFDPSPTSDDLDFLMHEVRIRTSGAPKLVRKDVLAVWTGIRPLVKDPSAGNTESICRRHSITLESNGLLTVTGGKWTVYRKMAEDTIDAAVKAFSLSPKRPCVTEYVKIVGGHRYTKRFYLEVQESLDVSEEVARHLAGLYGTRALKFASYFERGSTGVLSPKHPYLVEEVAYCIDNEMAVKICDVLCNRLMLGLVDVREAYKCIDKVLDVFRSKCHWDADRCNEERAEAVRLLDTYGLNILEDTD